MKLLTAEDEETDKLKELKATLLKYESPFSWDMPEVDVPIETYIRNQTEKCEVIEEEHQFQWTRFIPHLILSYEHCEKMNDYTQALEHIDWCTNHWNSLEHKCKEPLFASLRDVVPKVILATKAHILLAAGEVDLARKKAAFLENYLSSFYHNLRRPKDRIAAGLFGLKAAVYLQYQANGCRQALVYAKEAKNLDPSQAEWWFIIGIALARMRRKSNKDEVILEEEIIAIEKAFALRKDASYTVHLAQLYTEYSKQLFFQREYDNSRTYALTAATRFREALKMRPDCANLKARVAHGMLRIGCKEATDIPFAKNLLDEIVKSCPNKAMVFGDLGLYYTKYENDVEKAIFYFQKAIDIGSRKSIFFLASVKWKNSLEDQISADVQQCLAKFQSNDDQAMLYSCLGAYHALINDDWESAIPCLQTSLELDPSAQCMERFRGFNGKFVNLLELVTNHLYFREDDENEIIVKSFLAVVAQNKPQKVQLRQKDEFLKWKKELEKEKVCRNFKSKANIELNNSAKEKVTNNQANCMVEDHGSLGVISSQMAELIRSVNNLATTLATKEEVKVIGDEVELMKEEVKSIDEKVEALEPRITIAETRLDDLESKVVILEEAPLERLSVEEIIGEINDRHNRASNIILHNLPESNDEPLETKIMHDKDLVMKVCEAMNYILDRKEIKVNRIGKPMRGKCRPLIVIFNSTKEAQLFWEMLSTGLILDAVKDSYHALMNIGVTRDKTDRERQYIKSLREELETRRSNGERNLIIKYKNGVPAIFSKY